MKKIIITIVLAFFIVPITNAQIKKPKISVGKTKINAKKKLPALKVNDLRKLKTLNDLKKLNVPMTQVTEEQENAPSSQSRSINIFKLSDGDFRLVSASGYISTAPPLLYIYPLRSDVVTTVQAGSANSINTGAFPLKLSFRVVAGAEYRVKLKSSHRIENDYIYVATQFQGQQNYDVARININNQLDYNCIIQENNTGTMTVYFTAKSNLGGFHSDWIKLVIKEIQIDRIN